LEHVIEQLKHSQIDQLQEQGFEDGFNKVAFDRAMTSSSQVTRREAVILRLAQLRTDGVAIRNNGTKVHNAVVSEWVASVKNWMNEVIATIRHISEVDAERFKTLDVVPNPRLAVTSNCTTQAHQHAHLNAYRQHDYRLVRLDELLSKYRTG